MKSRFVKLILSVIKLCVFTPGALSIHCLSSEFESDEKKSFSITLFVVNTQTHHINF